MKLAVVRRTTGLAAALALSAPLITSAQNMWMGTGPDLNWSSPANWSLGTVPVNTDTLFFEDLNFLTGFTNGIGLINNVVDSSLAVGVLNYSAVSSAAGAHFYTTLIPSGSVLGVGTTDPTIALSVGNGATTGSATNYSTIKGAGALVVTNPQGTIQIQQVSRATLDLSGLNNFTANVSNLWVGANVAPDGSSKSGVLFLAKTNAITTAANLNAPGILIGKSTASCFGDISLGQDSTFDTDGLVVGGARAANASLFGISSLATSLNFLPGQTDPTFKLRGSAGGSSRVSTFSIGDIAALENSYLGGPGGSSTANADFSGGIVDILADSVFVGRSAADTGTGGGFTFGFGNLTLERGTVDVNHLNIAYKQGTNASSALNGSSSTLPCVVTVKSNAVMTVNQDVTIAFRNNGTNGSQIPCGSLVVNDNAVVNVGGNVTTPTNGISILQLGGGTINLSAAGNVRATTLIGSGSISGASSVTVVSNLSIGGPLNAGTLNLGGSFTPVNAFPIAFDLGATNTTGSGINDYLSVNGDVNFSNNPVVLNLSAPLLSGSNYTLVGFTGARNGLLAFTNATRSAIGLDQSTPGHVDLVVTNWTPATLTWQGITNNATNTWNVSNTYWTNSSGGADKFYQGDAVVFDDTAINPVIYPEGLLFPASVLIDCSAKNISITNRSNIAVGVIAGSTGITKNGTGTLTFGTISNTFTGPINVNNGSWRLFDPNFSTPPNMPTLGSINSPMYVNNGATLDLFGISSTATGKPIIVTGNGFGGQGAITNSSTSASVNGFALTLAGDTRLSADISGIGLKSLSLLSSIPPFSGLLNLNGHTLTKVGLNRFSLQDVVATNAGSLVISSGFVAVANCIIDGPGSLDLASGTYLIFGVSGTASTNGYVGKPITINNSGIVGSSSGNVAVPAIINSPITLNGPLSVTNTQPIIMNGSISGLGSITKYGTSNLVLNAANSYSGPTLITAGGLALGNADAVANSLQFAINPGATLDTTALGSGLTIAPGQTLNMNGAVVGSLVAGTNSTLLGSGSISGSFMAQPGAEIAMATTNVTGTMFVSNNLALNGAHFTWELAPSFDISDGFVVSGNLTLSGTNVFTVNSIGGFDPSGTNTLITYSGTLTGGLTNLALNSSARFIVEFVDPALTPGKIQIRLVTASPLLTWKGAYASGPRNWDVKTSPNWDNAGSPDIFWSSDLVRFDDTASTNVVNLVGTLGPASISMENSTLDYYFGGSGGLVASSLTLNGGNLTLTNTGRNFFTGTGIILNSGNLTVAQPTNTTLAANLSGSGSFIKSGASNLTVVGNSAAFNGAFNIAAGTLRAGSTNLLGIGNATVASGATLDVNGLPLLSQTTLQVAGVGADGFGAINNRGAGNTNALSNVALTGDTTFGALSNAWGIANGFQGAGFALTKTNVQDVWLMTAADTDLGAIDVRQGRLVFSVAGTTLGRSDSTVTVRANATLAFATTNAMNQTGPGPGSYDAGKKPVALLGNGAIEGIGFPVNQVSTNTHSGPISITNNAIFRVGGNSRLVLNGPISGTNAQVIVTNGGTLELNGTNTYTSNTLVFSGTLVLSNAASLPTNTTIFVSNNVTAGNPALQFLNGPVFSTNNILRVSSQNATVQVGGDGTWPGLIFLQGANTFNISGGPTLLDLAGQMITTNASGTVAFHGSNTRIRGSLAFNGSVTIGQGDGLSAAFGERFTTIQFDKTNNWTNVPLFERGRIIIGTNNALPPGVAFNQINTLSAGVGDRRVIFDLNGYNQSLAGIREVFPGNGLNIIGNSSTNSDSILTYAGTGTNTWTVQLVDTLDNPAIPHKLGLTVTSGLLETVTTNSYTGPTLVTGGKFLVSSIFLNSFTTLSGYLDASTVTVSATGTFGGNGVVAGNVTIGSGGTLSPGDSFAFLTSGGTTSAQLTRIGQLTLAGSDLTLNPGSRTIFEIDLSAGTNDAVVGIGKLTLGGTLVVTNLGAAPFVNGTVLKLFDFTSATAAPFAFNIQPSVPAPGLAWDASQLAIDGTLRVTTPPPSPAITGINRLADKNFSLSISGVDGRLYSLRASTNVSLPFTNWTVLQSAVQVSGSLDFTDLTATNSLQKFYLISAP